MFLQTDRTLNFHAPYGTHYSLRVPKFGRALAYNWNNCDLYVCGAGDEVYRLNLETGQFREPFVASFVGVNKMSINSVHNILGYGGESAACEFVDVRSRKIVSKLRVSSSLDVQVSSFKFDTDGLTLGVGTSDGNCILYDIRSSNPLYTKEHQYGLPIIDVSFHTNGATRRVISTDNKILKIWERDEGAGSTLGKIVTNIEPAVNINAVHVVQDTRGDSGLIFLAGDQPRVMSYFAPQLGPAPRWCTYLENLTEELEEKNTENGGSMYEDYKFITKTEVEELGASSLIGTPMLRGYMHGFFIEMKLYAKLRAVSKPFEYEEHRKKRIKEKINEKRASRITAKKRLPKVNAALAEKFMKTGKKDSQSDGVQIDDRFAALFNREEFQQDTETEEYKLRNPTISSGKKRSGNDDSDDELQQSGNDMGLFNRVGNNSDGSDDDELWDDNASVSDGDASDASDIGPRYVADDEPVYAAKSKKTNKKTRDMDEEGEISRATAKILKKKNAVSQGSNPVRKVKMFEAVPGVAQDKITFGHSKEAQQQRKEEKKVEKILIQDRLQNMMTAESTLKATAVGKDLKYISSDKGGIIRSYSFIPKSSNSSKKSIGEQLGADGYDEDFGHRSNGGQGKSKRGEKRKR